MADFNFFKDWFSITPADGTDLARVPDGLYIGGTGNVTVVSHEGNEKTFTAVPAGTILPIQPVQINATGTTATNLVGLLLSSPADPGSRAGDEAALQDLYSSANGASWTSNTGWAATGMSLDNPIHGVTVQTIGGELRVTSIDLRDNGLTGNINNTSFGNLTELTYFNVFFNELTGSIPDSIGGCAKLEYCYLNISDDTGDYRNEDPHEHILNGPNHFNHPGKNGGFGPGTDGRWNDFSGTVPDSIGNCSALKWFVLNWTSLQGWSNNIFDCTNLEGLHIIYNDGLPMVTKTIDPRIGNCTNLIELQLAPHRDNHETSTVLIGDCPSSMNNLINIRTMYLTRSQITTIPNMSSWISPRKIIVNANDLSGPFPDYLIDGTHPEIVTLNGQYQDDYFDNFPNGGGWSGQLPATGNHNLVSFLINGATIGGVFPAYMTQTNNQITIIGCKYCNFTSFETTDWTNLDSLRIARFDNNELSGQWPNLAWQTAGALDDLQRGTFAQNRFVFRDFLHIPSNGGGQTLLALWQAECNLEFTYENQKPFGNINTYNLSTGQSITLNDFDDDVSHPDNVYQWQKDGVDISGETNKTLSLTNVDSSDSGTYNLIVTNPGATDVTLTSEDIIINVS